MPKRATPMTVPLVTPVEKKKKKTERPVMPPPPAPHPVPVPAPQPALPRLVLNPVPRQVTGPERHLSRRIKLTVHPDGVVLTDTNKAENPDHAVRLSRGGWTKLKQVMGDYNAARMTPYQWDVDEFSTAPRGIQTRLWSYVTVSTHHKPRTTKLFTCISNIEWCTNQDDCQYPSRLGMTLNEEAWTASHQTQRPLRSVDVLFSGHTTTHWKRNVGPQPRCNR